MARTALRGYAKTEAGTTLELQTPDSSNKNTVPNWCTSLLVINKTGGAGSNCVVTVPCPGTYDGLAIADITVTVGFGADDVAVLIDLPDYLDNGDGTKLVNFDTETDIVCCPLG